MSQGLPGGPNAPYDVGEAEKTLAFGYNVVVERHLERVTIAAVALEGLRGLSSIDPEVGVARIGTQVLLTASDRVVAEYPLPGDDDVRGWSRLTVTIALDARGISTAMREASPEAIYEAVFDATLSKLDLFSRYAGVKEAREHRASRNGFGGIGIRFDLVDDVAKILEVMDDTPASQAGVKEGDIITHVGGEAVARLPKDEISKLLRGPVASDVELRLKRGGATVTATLHRALIVPTTVTAQLKDDVAAFRISSFNQRTAVSLATELKALRAKDKVLKGVVLDMRGNPGGLLDQAVSVVDLFVKDGPIVSTRGRHPLASQAYDAREGDIGEDLPVVVLVDGKSASAAEIVASALQDAGRAVVVGTNSYGKGTVQTVIRLPNDGEMTLTWSRFHTPSGYALHGLGVLPTICTAGQAVDTAALRSGIVQAAATSAPVTANLALWRSAQLSETGLRKQLRSTCPGAKHADTRLDVEMAESLLADPALYAHALTLSAPVAPPAAAAHPGHPGQVLQAVH
ncbi:MAG: S41 family peptidase [Magnetospirillum sp.]|nr:S41 family peptidase [Magnetospirillum sp.]